MKEKMKEFDISLEFKFSGNLTVEFESEKEAVSFARKHFMDVLKDHLRDKDNLNIVVKEVHTITPEERATLERDHIIEPIKEKEHKTKRVTKEPKEEKEPTIKKDPKAKRAIKEPKEPKVKKTIKSKDTNKKKIKK